MLITVQTKVPKAGDEEQEHCQGSFPCTFKHCVNALPLTLIHFTVQFAVQALWLHHFS